MSRTLSILGALAIAGASCGGSKAPETASPTADPSPTPVGPASPLHEHGSADERAQASPVESAPEAVPTTSDELLAAEARAYEAAKPVFEKYCVECHRPGAGSPQLQKKALKHLSMETYPFKGHHAHELGAIIRQSLGVDGGKITMPKNDKGSVKGEELALIVAWSRAFDAALASKGASDHGHHGKMHHDHGTKKKHDHGAKKKHDH